MNDAAVILGYTVLGLLLVALAAWQNDRVTTRFHEQTSRDKVFRCSRCGFVYTDDEDVSRAACPQCRQFNSPIEF